ncbi:MAG: multidrug effflux MFS transporter [Gammaproteobacteria bacterium]|nr:multidrug effflux MFS transporter [Gammaproteobacteria bacterium]
MKLGLLLGLLAGLGPLAIDLYLPAFPTLAAELHASPAQVQLSMVSFFLALAFGQLPYGALADRYGRRAPLFGGLALFMLTSIACALAPSIHWLIALRFLQGLGGCAGTIIARSIIRDLHSGAAAARLMATMFLVLGVSPIFAPLAGSLLLHWVGWRGLFVVIALLVALAALLVALLLPETHPPERRVAARAAHWHADFARLLGDGRYLQLAFAAAGASCGALLFVTAAPFVFARHYGLAPAAFSALLGLNGAGQILSTQLAPLLLRRLGAPRLLALATGVAALAGAALLLAALSGGASLTLFIALCFTVAVCVGQWLTPAAVCALDPHQAVAGSASAILGTIQLATTAVMSALVGLLESGDGRGIACGYLLSAGGAYLLCRRALARPRDA